MISFISLYRHRGAQIGFEIDDSSSNFDCLNHSFDWLELSSNQQLSQQLQEYRLQ